MEKVSEIVCESPSNIALVKYWGKKPVQIPTNPSISFSLTNCKTTTSVKLEDKKDSGNKFAFTFLFEGEPKPDFHPKIEKFLERVASFIPNVLQHHLIIDSKNSFPHSSGIASSASAMSALSRCLYEWEIKLTNRENLDIKVVSNMSRLGSGSAARSVFGGFAMWGQSYHYQGSDNEFAIQVPDHSDFFSDLQDCVLLIDKGQKKVSSTVGHDLMNGHPFAEKRYDQAQENLAKLLTILKGDDFNEFAELVESEALTLHAMMMTSSPSYILFRPNTIAVIEKIREKRASDNLPICFTLDAGANVHVIFPKSVINNAMDFIERELVGYCENQAYICDQIGTGQLVTIL